MTLRRSYLSRQDAQHAPRRQCSMKSKDLYFFRPTCHFLHRNRQEGLKMPVHIKDHQSPLYQRTQYEKGGIGRLYWDYRDRVIFDRLDKDDHRIADLGCGEGITLEKAISLFPEKEFLGIDLLAENLSICARRRLRIAGGDIYNLPFADGRFDCVLLLEVIEHLARPDAAISEINRILKQKGKLIVVFPNDKMFKITRLMTCKFKEAYYDVGHMRQWAPAEMGVFLDQHGFRILRQDSIPFLIWQLSLHHVVVSEKIA